MDARPSAQSAAQSAVSDDLFAMFEAAHPSGLPLRPPLRVDDVNNSGLDGFPSMSTSPRAPMPRDRNARADMLVGISGFTEFGECIHEAPRQSVFHGSLPMLCYKSFT